MKTLRLAVAALLLSLTACGNDGAPGVPECGGATSITATPEDALLPDRVDCVWQCATRTGDALPDRPVILAWETWERTGDGYDLTDSGALAGYCE